MPIMVNLDVMMAKRRIPSGELASMIGLSQANLSILKTGKAKAVRFSTLEAICAALQCQPGDILEYVQGNSEFGVRGSETTGNTGIEEDKVIHTTDAQVEDYSNGE